MALTLEHSTVAMCSTDRCCTVQIGVAPLGDDAMRLRVQRAIDLCSEPVQQRELGVRGSCEGQHQLLSLLRQVMRAAPAAVTSVLAVGAMDSSLFWRVTSIWAAIRKLTNVNTTIGPSTVPCGKRKHT